MDEIRFYLNIDYDEYLRYYQGSAEAVLVTSHDGRRLRFPANVLRPFVTRQGVLGEFALAYDDESRFKGIRRL